MFVGAIAELVNSFLLDCLNDFDTANPIYVLEPGGGSGCFAYRFINQLKELRSDFNSLKKLDVRYVLTDFAGDNIEAHLRNPRLRPFIDSGELEVAVFAPEVSNSIKLAVSGATLQRGSLKNPLLVVSNYFFDTIKHDAFRVDGGVLQETRVSISRPVQDEPGEGLPTIQEISLSESYSEIELPYYHDSNLDSILDFYRTNLSDSSVIFPIGAFRSIKNLMHMADDKVAIFASDKGFASLDSKQILGLRSQEFAEHGAFSFDVNFDALQRYFQNSDGAAVIESGDHSSLGFMFATSWGATCELTEHFFRQYIQKRDVINASYNLEEFTFTGCEKGKNFVRPYLTNFISIVQSSNFDPFIFDGALARLFERLVPELSQMDLEQELEVTELVSRTFNNVFNVANDYNDLAAILEFCMCWQKYEFCLGLAKQANASLGPSRKFFDYAALASEHLGRTDEAYEYFRQAYEMMPGHEWALEGMQRNAKPT